MDTTKMFINNAPVIIPVSEFASRVAQAQGRENDEHVTMGETLILIIARALCNETASIRVTCDMDVSLMNGLEENKLMRDIVHKRMYAYGYNVEFKITQLRSTEWGHANEDYLVMTITPAL